MLEKIYGYLPVSPTAQSIMEYAQIQLFAVDDCILLTHSKNFKGWSPEKIKTVVKDKKITLSEEIDNLRQDALRAIPQRFKNNTIYGLISFKILEDDSDNIEVIIAPFEFFDFYSLIGILNNPSLDNGISIREKYAKYKLTYDSHVSENSILPSPISIQCVIVTQDNEIVMMQRSTKVGFHPGSWAVSFEETMDAPQGNSSASGDGSFFDAVYRGLKQEFAIEGREVNSVKILSLNTEGSNLALNVIGVANISLTSHELKERWLYKAIDKDEAKRFECISVDLKVISTELFSNKSWHPTSRMRLLQFLFYSYGVEDTTRTINEVNVS